MIDIAVDINLIHCATHSLAKPKSKSWEFKDQQSESFWSFFGLCKTLDQINSFEENIVQYISVWMKLGTIVLSAYKNMHAMLS